MRILSLDIATTSGWATWNSVDGTVAFGEVTFPSELGAFADGFDRWLNLKVAADQITHMVVEAPISAQGATRQDILLRLYGAHVIARKTAHRKQINIDSISVGTWRSYFIGTTRAPSALTKAKRRSWLKAKSIQECKERGYAVTGDNEADALGILCYSRAMHDPSYGTDTTDLFRPATSAANDNKSESKTNRSAA